MQKQLELLVCLFQATFDLKVSNSGWSSARKAWMRGYSFHDAWSSRARGQEWLMWFHKCRSNQFPSKRQGQIGSPIPDEDLVITSTTTSSVYRSTDEPTRHAIAMRLPFRRTVILINKSSQMEWGSNKPIWKWFNSGWTNLRTTGEWNRGP